ncbi:MAG: anti-sigma factor family protein [Nitriliruptorales bacterium]
MKSTCERVRARLPRLVDGTLPGWRRGLLERHLARCEECASELERQRAVAEGLRGLAEVPPGPEAEPPDELLDAILERVHEPGARERAAGPARGAVSGARPELSVAAVVLAALVVYLAWRAARAILHRSNGSD